AVPERWAEAYQPPVAVELSSYWRLLGDPLLTQFVEAGVARNLDLAQAAARLDQARAAVHGARAGYWPQVSATGRTQRDVGDFADSDLQFGIGADVAWEADLFGRIGLEVAASQADLAAAG